MARLLFRGLRRAESREEYGNRPRIFDQPPLEWSQIPQFDQKTTQPRLKGVQPLFQFFYVFHDAHLLCFLAFQSVFCRAFPSAARLPVRGNA